MEINTEVLEKTGPAFSVDALMSARSKTKEAISMIAHSVKPGMLEEEARQIAKETLDRMGRKRGGTRSWCDSAPTPSRISRILPSVRFACAMAISYLSISARC